ncbi:MAG: glycosyltransferase [Planctomycetota bacterium]|jgi:glycosyltransferase involved in cell wall biosynthesis
MRVLWFGTYSVGTGYPRNTVLIDALRSVGVEVVECHVPLFQGARDKVAAASTVSGLVRFGAKALLAWARLAAGFFRAGPRDVVVVGYTGHLDVFLARALSVAWRTPVVLDAFLSPYDTVVGDRRLLDERSLAARSLFRLERLALRNADLVLTDTRAHSEFMARVFGLPRRRFLSVPVGSLVHELARVPVAVPAGGGGGERRPFTAFFCGSFVPLQGVPYILDAAERAPDIRFHIVGDGPDGAIVQEEVERRAMDNVRLDRRFIPREEMEGHLARADAVLGVFGRTDKSLRVVPCKVYDGLAAGLPVVTGGGPAPEELLTDGENALLVDRSDPGSLVKALRRLRDEPGLSDRLRRGARGLARRRFSAEAIGARLENALQELVA